jgi:hypothetical protein
VWTLAQYAAPEIIPDSFDDVISMHAYEHGWPVFEVGGDRWLQCVRVMKSQQKHAARRVSGSGGGGGGGAVVVAGDYVGGGTLEGAARSGLWAAQAVLTGLARGPS